MIPINADFDITVNIRLSETEVTKPVYCQIFHTVAKLKEQVSKVFNVPIK